MGGLDKHARTSLIVALGATVSLGALIILGSRGMRHADPALTGYTVATLLACFGVVYRATVWLHRPPTALYLRKGWRVLSSKPGIMHNLRLLVAHLPEQFAIQRFIWRRGRLRWGAHALIAWGCVLASLITFPLVFGWVHFQVEATSTALHPFEWYRVYLFGLPTIAFRVTSVVGFLFFHALSIASLLVIAGCSIALWRRLAGLAPRRADDLIPLVLLLAVSVTGLALTVSYVFLAGAAHPALARVHELTVIITLLWLPFGKFFHIFQRPLQLACGMDQTNAARDQPAPCSHCGRPFVSQTQLADLIKLQNDLGFNYALPNPTATGATHYQQLCPACRRLLVMRARIEMSTTDGPHP